MRKQELRKVRVVFQQAGKDWGIATTDSGKYLFFYRHIADDRAACALDFDTSRWRDLYSQYFTDVYKNTSFEEASLMYLSENLDRWIEVRRV